MITEKIIEKIKEIEEAKGEIKRILMGELLQNSDATISEICDLFFKPVQNDKTTDN